MFRYYVLKLIGISFIEKRKKNEKKKYFGNLFLKM